MQIDGINFPEDRLADFRASVLREARLLYAA